MADEKAETQETAAPGDEFSPEVVLGRVEHVLEDIHRAIDSNHLSDAHDRRNLEQLSDVLEKIKGRLTAPQSDPVKKDEQAAKKEDPEEPLPRSKREELAKLLVPEIERALRQLKKPPRGESSERDALKKKKKQLLAAGCSPFNKLRLSPEKKNSEQGRQEEEEEEEVSVKLLVRLAEHVLEPEQYYEWTTSYVDESRIFGWDEEATKVMDSLIDPEEDGDFFRAAAITGIHGSGKTALAQKVFVHDKAKDHFPIRLWVCVGPPDSEDRFNLLYRMLDNLGLDTNKVEDVIVDAAKVVNQAREKEAVTRLPTDELGRLWKAATETAKKRKQDEEGQKKEEAGNEDAKVKYVGAKEGAGNEDAEVKYQGEKKEKAGVEDTDIVKEEYSKLIKQKIEENKVLKQEIEDSTTVKKSKIGVLLYILHVTLSKTGYLIVFDDIRVYKNGEFGDDGWYQNLTLPPPPDGVEWSDRLAYGLPKMTGKHRSAVLVTCRKEDDAKTMVRTGRVFRPPPLQVDNGWKLFEREYKQAKELKASKENKKKVEGEEDLLFKELGEMKKEIVDKCLGLPVAIIEAAKGFALSDYGPLPEPDEAANKSADDKIGSSKKTDDGDQTKVTDNDKPDESKTSSS